MSKTNLITLEELSLAKKFFRFNKKKGIFTWKIHPPTHNPHCVKGGFAGCYDKDSGYYVIVFGYKKYKAYRLAWVWVYGLDNQPERLDHIDGNRRNNAITNLRPASASQNCHNRKIASNNTSGVKGLYFIKKKKLWRAAITFEGRVKYIGSFKLLEDAKAAIAKSRELLHNDFCNHG